MHDCCRYVTAWRCLREQVWEGELKHFGSVKRLRSLMAGAGRKTAAQSLSDLATNDAMVDL
jgi:hypothetical protein